MRYSDKQFDVTYEASKTRTEAMLKLISEMGFKPSVNSLKKAPK